MITGAGHMITGTGHIWRTVVYVFSVNAGSTLSLRIRHMFRVRAPSRSLEMLAMEKKQKYCDVL